MEGVEAGEASESERKADTVGRVFRQEREMQIDLEWVTDDTRPPALAPEARHALVRKAG